MNYTALDIINFLTNVECLEGEDTSSIVVLCGPNGLNELPARSFV